MRVCDERTHVAMPVRQPLSLVFGLEPRVPLFYALVPTGEVTFVDRVRGAALGALHVGVREEELADPWVERKAVHAVAGRQKERGRALP